MVLTRSCRKTYCVKNRSKKFPLQSLPMLSASRKWRSAYKAPSRSIRKRLRLLDELRWSCWRIRHVPSRRWASSKSVPLIRELDHLYFISKWKIWTLQCLRNIDWISWKDRRVVHVQEATFQEKSDMLSDQRSWRRWPSEEGNGYENVYRGMKTYLSAPVLSNVAPRSLNK